MKKIIFLILGLFSFMQLYSMNKSVKSEVWNNPSVWDKGNDSRCSIKIDLISDEQYDKVFKVNYNFRKGSGWVEFRKRIDGAFNKKQPLVFNIKTDSENDLEVKFQDHNGAVFEKRFSLRDKYLDWTPIVIYLDNLEYFYGGKGKNKRFGKLTVISFAISGREKSGDVYFSEIRLGEPGLEATFKPAGQDIDPNRNLRGIGFTQRRADQLVPEEPLVLEYLKQMQDTSSPDKKLIPSQEDLQASTFNNALVAMVFMLKGERERAERILDFYANATDPDNTDKTLQNFFYNGESRGFFQFCYMKDTGSNEAYHNMYNSDRWMGDMAWLLIAYKDYEQKYKSNRYERIQKLLLNLLKDFFLEDSKKSGYVQHGWRKGDKRLHEASGHPEGNIDCYAVFMLYGEPAYAKKISNWLKKALKDGKNLPLDLYGWRVLALGKKQAGFQKRLLDIPEFDFRYRKIITLHGKEKVMGFYHGPEDKNNLWLDGIGHMSVAYYTVGNIERGCFYANQYDKLLIDRVIDGKKTKTLPYVLDNTDPNYPWVNPKVGFSSVCAWYIFAKNKFNPMRLEQY